MIHGINNNILYAVSLIETHFVKEGKQTQVRQGTGFFVTKDSKLYFITNRHVLDITRENVKFNSYELGGIFLDIRQYDERTHSVKVKKCEIRQFNFIEPDEELDDVACLYNLKIEGEAPQVNTSFSFDLLADAECIEKQISVCDSLAIIGFPVVYDHLNNMPILRSGVVSSDPRLNYSISNQYMGHVIAYEAFSTGGSSGSPVVDLQKGFPLGEGLQAPKDFFRPVKVIGINAGCFNRDGVHQQLSYMYKSDIIIDLILAAENDNDITT